MHCSAAGDAAAAAVTGTITQQEPQQQQQQSLYLHDWSLPQNCGVDCSLLMRDFQVCDSSILSLSLSLSLCPAHTCSVHTCTCSCILTLVHGITGFLLLSSVVTLHSSICVQVVFTLVRTACNGLSCMLLLGAVLLCWRSAASCCCYCQGCANR
jgi:hypothetical protein